LDAVARFKVVAQDRFGDLGTQAATLAYNLEAGAGPTSSSLDEEKLELTVAHPKAMQGEMATRSHMPIMWTLAKTTVYTLVQDDDGAVKLVTEGVGLSGFPEGRKLYKDSNCEEACKDKDDFAEKIMCEKDVLYSFFKKQWDTMSSSGHLKNAENKMSRVLKPMYGSSLTYRAVKMKGKGAWERIIYPMATIPRTATDYFRFYMDGKDMEVSVRQHAIDGDEEMMVKNGAEFNAKKFASERAMGEAFARSGMNFAAMVAAGRTDLNGAKIHGGSVKYILKLASACTKGNKPDKYGDITHKCTGDEGRVIWQ